MSLARESRPELAPGAAPESVVATHPQGTDGARFPHLSHTDAVARLRDCYAVIVAGKTVRKHLYFNLPAAKHAVTRAQARGATAHMILVRLVPVDHRQLDQLEAVITDA